MRTPWGTSDYRKEYASGIVFYGTPSHGGFKLDEARNALIPADWRRWDGWYEEDCDANYVAATFPLLFPDVDQAEVAEAIEWAENYRREHPILNAIATVQVLAL
jgi:hypothetical protein